MHLVFQLKNKFSNPEFRRKRAKVFAAEGIESIFTEIYKTNYWANDESVSGSGSTIRYTENLRHELPGLFSKFSVKTVFDAPCGDLNWMSTLLSRDILQKYIGADIVEDLIISNKNRFGADSVEFVHMDLTKGNYPLVDLMICRDLLFHLSYHDARLVLERFIRSGIPYLLVTTHLNDTNFKNRDIISGDYRLTDLFSSPYGLPADPAYRIDDWNDPEPKRQMCLWTREQVMKSSIAAAIDVGA